MLGAHLMMGASGGGDGLLLYNAMLNAGPLALWDFDEASGNIADDTGNGNTLTSFAGTITYQDWTSPDGVVRASFTTGSAANLTISSGIQNGIANATGLSFVWNCVPTAAAQNFIGQLGAANQDYYRVYYDGANFYVRVGRDNGGAYRLWRIAKTTSEIAAIRLLYVYQADKDTLPTVRVNGSAWTLTSFSGPNGTVDTNGNDFWAVGYRAGNYTGDVGPIAVYAGQLDPTDIETAATDEGWY